VEPNFSRNGVKSIRFQSLTEKCAVRLALGAESFESDDASFDHLRKPLQKCTILSLKSDKSRVFDGFLGNLARFGPNRGSPYAALDSAEAAFLLGVVGSLQNHSVRWNV
jgi:hypothetical protein